MITIPERSFTRAEIIARLRTVRSAGDPIVAVAAGVGIVAKCAEIGGADLIIVEASSKSRNLGTPTIVYLGNPTQLMLDMYPEIDNVVDRTPIIVGWDATDGTRRRMNRVIDQYRGLGIDGITNFPTSVGEGTPNWGKARMDVNMGVDREWELMRLARESDFFSVGMAYTAEMATELARNGADLIVARCGLTVGGGTGPAPDGPGVLSREEAVAHVQELLEAARAVNPDVFVLAHGGPFARPADTEYLYTNTDVQGYLAESAVERIAVEDAVAAEIARFKHPVLRETARV